MGPGNLGAGIWVFAILLGPNDTEIHVLNIGCVEDLNFEWVHGPEGKEPIFISQLARTQIPQKRILILLKYSYIIHISALHGREEMLESYCQELFNEG